jgi:hypothetical protein
MFSFLKEKQTDKDLFERVKISSFFNSLRISDDLLNESIFIPNETCIDVSFFEDNSLNECPSIGLFSLNTPGEKLDAYVFLNSTIGDNTLFTLHMHKTEDSLVTTKLIQIENDNISVFISDGSAKFEQLTVPERSVILSREDVLNFFGITDHVMPVRREQIKDSFW